MPKKPDLSDNYNIEDQWSHFVEKMCIDLTKISKEQLKGMRQCFMGGMASMYNLTVLKVMEPGYDTKSQENINKVFGLGTELASYWKKEANMADPNVN